MMHFPDSHISLRQRAIALVLIALQCGGMLGFSGHTHDLALRFGADAAVSAHTCGSHERHIPIEDLRACPACWQLNQRNAIPAIAQFTVAITPIQTNVAAPSDIPLPPGKYLHPQKRGPPVVA
jgi:hypothetical protein